MVECENGSGGGGGGGRDAAAAAAAAAVLHLFCIVQDPLSVQTNIIFLLYHLTHCS